MQRFFIFLLLIASTSLTIISCGNKGPLYLPAEPVETTEDIPTTNAS